MNRHVIRTSETDSVKGIATTQHVDVNLRQTTKALPFPNVNTTLSQRGVYEEERQKGSKFRLILTIVPYCSNVLFNALTEIVKDEGSDNPTVVTDTKNASDISGCYGNENPSRVQMICDSEYSSPLHGGFTYHPGYDFFDNHILRNKTFKLVNVLKGGTDERNVFNTLSDFARDRNGEKIQYWKRGDINNVNSKNKHLYLEEDIMPIDESINRNLFEDKGWWGFVNNTSIDTKEIDGVTKLWKSMDVSRAINNRKPCEFVDMYPDRSLFSFTPKHNEFQHKEENNWNVVITYPYKNIYDHPICLGGSSYVKRTMNEEGEYVEESVSEGNRWMGLKVMNVTVGSGKIGGNNLIFRTYTKHGLSQQDTFYVYYTNPYVNTNDKFNEKTLNGGEMYYESQIFYKVTNVGDLSRENDDYYFYTSNLALLNEIYQSYLKYAEDKTDTTEIPFYEDYELDDKKGIYDEDGKLKEKLLNEILENTNFRIRRCVKGVKSTYYMRLLRKVPNLRAAKREMTEEEKMHRSKFNGVFDNYISENAMDPENPKYQRLVNNEQYQMAFAANIYNDNVSQITFSDGIDTEGLTDNLGRPLSELFYTVVKNNAGHEVWYDSGEPLYSNKEVKDYIDDKGKKDFKEKYGVDYDGYTVEYSHCFGRITSGLEMYFKKNDTESVIGPVSYLKKLSSAQHISNIVHSGKEGSPIGVDTDSKNLEENITYKNTFFYGDLVEFNIAEFEEHVLSNVMHRFNTAQRETINNPNYSEYQYHEILSDDYDKDDFQIKEFSAVNGLHSTNGVERSDYETISRPEGYIYKAHYSIPIREYTRILQGSHTEIRVGSATPVQRNGILIRVKTRLFHHLNENDIIFICDDETDTRYITKCVSVIDNTTFLMSPDYTEIITNATDFEDIESETNFNDAVYGATTENSVNFKKRLSWLELCEILNGKYSDDLTHAKLVLRRKNPEIPDYATYIGGNQYVWRDIINIGDNRVEELPDYIFANGYFYITNRINFYLKRQDPFGNNGLYFDGETNFPYFPSDPSGILQQENNFITKETTPIC